MAKKPRGAIPTVLAGNRMLQQKTVGTWKGLDKAVSTLQKRLNPAKLAGPKTKASRKYLGR